MYTQSSIRCDTKDIADGSLISVIIPIYKVEPYLRRCLDSVVGQTYKNLEIICVDDGSPDGCGAICEEYAAKDERIRVIHKENGGQSSARNAGLDIAQGEYISFIDSDDFVASDMVEYLYRLLKAHDADISVCLHDIVRGEKRWKSYNFREDIVIGPKECLQRLLYNDGVDTSAWAKLYKKDIFADICFPEGKLSEDSGTTYRTFLASKRIVLGHEAKYFYMLRENSTVTCAFAQWKLDMLEMTDLMARDVVAIYSDLEKAAIRRRVYARFTTLNQMIYAGSEWEEKRQEMISFIKANAGILFADSKVQCRDKIAIVLLFIGYPLYRFVWEHVGKK